MYAPVVSGHSVHVVCFTVRRYSAIKMTTIIITIQICVAVCVTHVLFCAKGVSWKRGTTRHAMTMHNNCAHDHAVSFFSSPTVYKLYG